MDYDAQLDLGLSLLEQSRHAEALEILENVKAESPEHVLRLAADRARSAGARSITSSCADGTAQCITCGTTLSK